jgi:N-acetyl-anhydromuramyl-L-alanine amidase AmpD
MKYEISDVDKQEMAYFLQRIFNGMKIHNDDVNHINRELSEYGYELSWTDWADEWQIFYH